MTPPGPRRSVPAPVDVPRPPEDPAALDPLTTTWPAGAAIHRCYDVAWGPRDFRTGDARHRGRFHPFRPGGGDHEVPVLYGADTAIGALSETVFHDVPVRGVKHVPYARLRHRLLVEVEPVRALTLVDLSSLGLRRLGLSRSELIESDARAYPVTAAWARALHAHPLAADGLSWISRQHDSSRSIVLFADRVGVAELRVPGTHVPLTLGAGAGLDLVCDVADLAGITIVDLP